MHLKTFTTDSLNEKYEFSNDMFFEYEYEGVDDVPYLSEAFSVPFGDENFIVLAIDEFKNTVAGAIVITKSSQETHNGTGAKSWVCGIGVNENYTKQKLSRKLINEMFKVCENVGIDKIEQSSYTDIGKVKVKPLFEEIEKQYPRVQFIDVLNLD